MSFASQNHINHKFLNIFAQTLTSKCQIFDIQVMIISTLNKIVHSKSFGREKYNFRDVRDIYKKTRQNKTPIRFRILLLVSAKMDSQILTIVRGRIRFQAFSY